MNAPNIATPNIIMSRCNLCHSIPGGGEGGEIPSILSHITKHSTGKTNINNNAEYIFQNSDLFILFSGILQDIDEPVAANCFYALAAVFVVSDFAAQVADMNADASVERAVTPPECFRRKRVQRHELAYV